MKYLVPPISLRRRDWHVTKLLRRGYATDDELFAVQYKEWPNLKGLEKDTPRDKTVLFKDYWQDENNKGNWYLYLMSLGYVSDEATERQMHLNRFLLSPLGHVFGILSTRLAWARFHDAIEIAVDGRPSPAGVAFFLASMWSSYRYAVGSSFTQMLTPSLADTVGHEHIHVIQLRDKISRVNDTDFQSAAEKLVDKEDMWTQFKKVADAALSWMPLSYFTIDHEIQARLHNIMVQGYPSWKQMPQTESELLAALRDRGIKMPKFERKWLTDKQQAGLRRTYGKLGRRLRGYWNPASAEINIGLNSHHNIEVLEAYWRQYLPSLYADLLVLYGDSKGHSRMGFRRPIDVTKLKSGEKQGRVIPAPTG